MADNSTPLLKLSMIASAFMHNRCFHRLGECPPELKSAAHNVIRNAKRFAPLNNRHADTVIFDNTAGRPVASLLFSRSPSAVVWFIVTIIVDSFKCVACCRLFSHVCKEIGKRHPLFAHSDTATSIPTIVRRTWGQAPTLHCLPCCIRAGWINASACMSVFFRATLNTFRAFTHPKVRTLDGCDSATFTRTLPSWLPLPVQRVGFFNHQPATKPSTSQINDSCHIRYPFMADSIVYQV